MKKKIIISLTTLIMCNLSCSHKNRDVVEQLNDEKINVEKNMRERKIAKD